MLGVLGKRIIKNVVLKFDVCTKSTELVVILADFFSHHFGQEGTYRWGKGGGFQKRIVMGIP